MIFKCNITLNLTVEFVQIMESIIEFEKIENESGLLKKMQKLDRTEYVVTYKVTRNMSSQLSLFQVLLRSFKDFDIGLYKTVEPYLLCCYPDDVISFYFDLLDGPSVRTLIYIRPQTIKNYSHAFFMDTIYNRLQTNLFQHFKSFRFQLQINITKSEGKSKSII